MRKIPTLFVRDQADRAHVTREVTPGCEWVLEGEGVATAMHDGVCVMLDAGGVWWVHAEVKPGRPMPANFRMTGRDELAGSWAGWVPAVQAWCSMQLAMALLGTPVISEPGTYELIGPLIEGNPHGVSEDRLVAHGAVVLDVGPRSFDRLHDLFRGPFAYEGIVFWRKPGDLFGGLAKIKGKDFA